LATPVLKLRLHKQRKRTMDLDELVADGWRRHADEPQAVHDQLAGAIDRVVEGKQVPAVSRLLTHLHAEHLDDRAAGIAVLEVLRMRFESGPPQGYRVATTGLATLRFLDIADEALTSLTGEERASALSTAASALAGHQRFSEAVAAYLRALDEAASGLPERSPAFRVLAVGGNNMATALERKAGRDEGERAAMVRIADAALTYWRVAGGWMEEERAHYRCARSRLAAGLAHEAVECAQACLRVCELNDAPAFERFFAFAVGAVAWRADGHATEAARWRAAALEQYRKLASEERSSCQDELDELGAAP
jgi:hypothetical protein